MIEVDAEVLERAFRRVAHAVAHELARPILNTVLLEGDGAGLRLVAADNYRLVVAEVTDKDATEVGNFLLADLDIPVVRGFLRTHHRAVDLEISATPNRHLAIRDGRGTVTVEAMIGAYPNYKFVLADGPGQRMPINVNPAYLVQSAAGLRIAKASMPLAMKEHVPLPGQDRRLPLLVTAPGYTEAIMPMFSHLPDPAKLTKAQQRAKAQREYRARPEVKERRNKKHRDQRAAYREKMAREA